MHEYRVKVDWSRRGSDFLGGRYSREHTWSFDGGFTVPASPSPYNVAAPYANPSNVDPEEAFVAAVSSCHMLTFLFLAYQHGVQVDSYADEALAVTTRDERGCPYVSNVTLRPRIAYGGARTPTADDERRLHHLAHEQCIIANSVRSHVTVEPPRRDA